MPLNGAKTFYDILGVPKDASQDDLRKAWLALARKHHPDKTGGHRGSEEKLKVVNEAYDTLKRPEKRRQYDEMLSGAFQAEAPVGAGAAHGRSADAGSEEAGHFEFNGDYTDFFGDLFGQRTQGRQRGPRPGRDLEAEASVSLKEAATGTTKSFRVPSMVSCQSCSGTGAAPGTRAQPCPQCKGAGQISGGRGSLFVMSQTCPLCRGRGEVIATPCPACGGSGFRTEARTLSIAIPAGVRTGTRLRLAGQGEPGEPGAPQGDLFVVVRVEENDLFQRQRNDLLCEVPITFTQAVRGGVVEVPTLQGKARLTIPAGTQTGTILRMRGQGLPPFNGGHKGDQLVKVMIEVPRKVTHDQVAAVQKLHETTSLDAYPKHHAYADRLKRWQQS
jgi:molecular chaperone DnaJ